MNCAKCGLDLPSGVKTCPKCGSVNEFLNTAEKPKQVNPWYYAIGGAAAVAILALVVAVIAGRGSGVLEAPAGVPGPPKSIMDAPVGKPPGGNVMAAPPGRPGPSTTSPSVQKPKPPQAVLDYLNFVKGVEEHRQMLLKDTAVALGLASQSQTQSLLALIDMAMDPEGKAARDPLAEQKKELARQYKNWLATLRFFDGRSAPSECREFSGAYRNVIYSETKAIGEVAVGLNGVNIMNPEDLSKLLAQLQKMKADPNIQENIDKAADDADAKLTLLVSQYDMEKPFDVPREKKTTGSIMGF